jgi:hypothetical protein
MVRRRRRDAGKERYWRQVVSQWQRSGLSIRAFCAARGLSEQSRMVKKYKRALQRGPLLGRTRSYKRLNGPTRTEFAIERGVARLRIGRALRSARTACTACMARR